MVGILMNIKSQTKNTKNFDNKFSNMFCVSILEIIKEKEIIIHALKSIKEIKYGQDDVPDPGQVLFIYKENTETSKKNLKDINVATGRKEPIQNSSNNLILLNCFSKQTKICMMIFERYIVF